MPHLPADAPWRVAILGPEHTQSHGALSSSFPSAVPVFCADFAQAVDACLRGRDAFVPVHNVLGGPVRGLIDALREVPPLCVRRYELHPIRHVLAARPDHRGGTGAVVRVRTRDQARLQCRERLSRILPHAAYVDEASTVAPLAAGLLPGDALVVTPRAAAAYALRVLDPDVGPAGNASLFALVAIRPAVELTYGAGAREYVASLARDGSPPPFRTP